MDKSCASGHAAHIIAYPKALHLGADHRCRVALAGLKFKIVSHFPDFEESQGLLGIVSTDNLDTST
jgi:hypothetical protein